MYHMEYALHTVLTVALISSLQYPTKNINTYLNEDILTIWSLKSNQVKVFHDCLWYQSSYPKLFLTILYFVGVIFSWQKKPLHGPESFSPSLNGQTALLDNGPPTWDLLP